MILLWLLSIHLFAADRTGRVCVQSISKGEGWKANVRNPVRLLLDFSTRTSEHFKMSEHKAIISWKSNVRAADFLKGRFSREHTWKFDGGVTVPASASPSVVPTPLSNPANVDPEEAFVASVSSCHMLTYVYLAYRQGFQVDSYEDEAVGSMTKNEKGVPWVSSIVLNPKIVYSGDKSPSPADEEHLHHLAHAQCFISNSIKTTITVQKPAAV